MGSYLRLLLITSALLLSDLPGDRLVLAEEMMAPAGQALPPSSAAGKFHFRLLERGGGGALFKNRHLRSDLLQEVRKVLPANAQPRVLEVVDFQVDDGDVFDGNSKRFDDYGHSRFGKRNEFDDYGHSRFGRK